MDKRDKLINSCLENKGDDDMLATQKRTTSGLTKDKKELLKKAMGAASSKTIILNKIREEWKNGNS